MVGNRKKELLTSFVKNTKNLESQRRILDELNEFLKIYPLIMDSNENMLYQEKVARKYVNKSIFNGTSSVFCSAFSLFLSEHFLDADISDFKEFLKDDCFNDFHSLNLNNPDPIDTAILNFDIEKAFDLTQKKNESRKMQIFVKKTIRKIASIF